MMTDRTSNELGHYLRRLRQQREVSMYDLAVQLDKQPPYFSKLERGRIKNVNLGDLYALVAALAGDYPLAIRLAAADAGVPAAAWEVTASPATN